MENDDSSRRSFYENSQNDPGGGGNNNKSCKFPQESPTQTNFLNTTVPQNITRQDIAGRHAPTRNSLRHSRMIVLNKSGQVTTDVPLFLEYFKWAYYDRIIVLILGLSLGIFSLWLMLWSPNIRSRDNPYWNAGPAIISGISGLLFIKSSPKIYTEHNVTYWIKSLKSLSLASSILTFSTSCAVCVFSILHLISLYHLRCAPPDKLYNTCICSNIATNTTEESFFPSYHYVDLNCFEVNNVLTIFTALISTLSVLLVLAECLYLYMHWAGSRSRVVYSRVPLKQIDEMSRPAFNIGPSTFNIHHST